MTDRPILFSGPMVRAILQEIEKPGTGKTMTRRILSWQPGDLDRPFMMDDGTWHITDSQGANMSPLDVKYRACDRLWVRERCRTTTAGDDGAPDIEPPVWYLADGECQDTEAYPKARPSIHMPRWASRITLEVTGVEVERLQDISEEDAIAEGWPPVEQRATTGVAEIRDAYPIGWFANLWDSLNKERGFGWEVNPWVVAITFKPFLCNIDAMKEKVA